MIELLEKLINEDFKDVFQPASEEEIERRWDEMISRGSLMDIVDVLASRSYRDKRLSKSIFNRLIGRATEIMQNVYDKDSTKDKQKTFQMLSALRKGYASNYPIKLKNEMQRIEKLCYASIVDMKKVKSFREELEARVTDWEKLKSKIDSLVNNLPKDVIRMIEYKYNIPLHRLRTSGMTKYLKVMKILDA